MALRTARIQRVRGRPPLLAAGSTSLIHSHSSSVRSLGYVFSFIYPCYTTHEDFSDRLSGAEGSCSAFHIGASTSPICRQFFFYLNRQKKHETSDRAVYSVLNQNKKGEGLFRPQLRQRSVKH